MRPPWPLWPLVSWPPPPARRSGYRCQSSRPPPAWGSLWRLAVPSPNALHWFPQLPWHRWPMWPLQTPGLSGILGLCGLPASVVSVASAASGTSVASSIFAASSSLQVGVFVDGFLPSSSLEISVSGWRQVGQAGLAHSSRVGFHPGQDKTLLTRRGAPAVSFE